MTKNQPCDVIKMREIRGEFQRKPIKKKWMITHFYDVTWLICESLSPSTHPVMGGGGGGIVILVSYDYHFISVQENLMQHPSSKISIHLNNVSGIIRY